MVGIVVVSHSPSLADGVVELARQMGGDELRLEAAGGLEDGSIGTDVERVRAAIERAMSDDGVLVLMDLGSALLSAEMAIEMLESGGRVEMSEAPLVEGAVAAAVAARGGASLERVRAEARGAIAMKEAQLGVSEDAEDAEDAEGVKGAKDGEDADAPVAKDGSCARIPVLNEIGLHARPAALVAELASRYEADLRLSKQGGAGPVSARSLTGIMTLVARKGDELIATASGPQAEEALAALEELARGGFGEGVAGNARSAPAPAAERDDQRAPAPEAGETLHGIPASAGIGLGPVRHLGASFDAPAERASEGADVERRRLDQARAAARAAVERDRDEVARRSTARDAAIFDAHRALLDDDALIDGARARIEAGETAESAWYAASVETAAAWRSLDDELLRERAADVEDVGRRVLAALTGTAASAEVAAEGVLVVSELTPADAASVDPAVVRGIAAARGTATAHAAILSRALGIPAVVGLGDSVLAIGAGTPVLLDGEHGTVLVAPSEAQAGRAFEQRARALARREQARRHASEPAVTLDGVEIEVSANLAGAGAAAGAGAGAARAGGAAAAVEFGADGVGLLRTEFLFLDRDEIPDEEEQVRTLAQIASELDGRPLIVRTLDVGADKPLRALPMPAEQNPFLGRRGIRLSLEHPELLATQLRAVLRVAADHPLKVMFPMVAAIGELETALQAVASAREATGVDAPLEVGIMVEVPSAALEARQLAAKADFFSIGTNDLTQYTMAAERGNEHVADLLSGPQPAVLRLIAETVAGAEAFGRWVGVCGELAGDPAAAILLIGLGVRELSMAPLLVPEVKAALRLVTVADAADVAKRALEARDAPGARRLAGKLLT